MRTYAEKHQPPQQGKSGHPARPSTAARSREVHPILHMQHTIGNQAVQRLLQQAKPDDLETRSGTKEVTHFGHDFSRIPTHPESTESVQAQLPVNPPEDIYEQEADRGAEQVMRTSGCQCVRVDGSLSCVPLWVSKICLWSANMTSRHHAAFSSGPYSWWNPPGIGHATTRRC